MKLLAIDPGQKGALAFYSPLITNKVMVELMPLGGKEIDYASLATIIKDFDPDLAVVEKVGSMPGQGVTSMFTFGMGYGALFGILAALQVPTERVAPQTWKASVLKGTLKDKAAAIDYCRRVFPTVPLVPPRCRKPHDGIADALCILSYAQRTWGREQEVA